MILTATQKKHNIDFLNSMIRSLPSSAPDMLPSEHAEKNRILPPNTPRPGPYDISMTEYFREPMDNFAPWSPIQHTTFMKPVQFGATTFAESIIIYYMDHVPSDILYLTAKGDNVERWVNRLENAIESYGIRNLFVNTAGPQKGRSSADKHIQKNYRGCQANFGSLRSLADMSSETKRLVIRDECSQVPLYLSSGHGSVMKISYARTNAWGKLRKVLDISTPGVSGSCAMEIEFLAGDQRYYWMPCPKCGEYQLLEFERLWSAKNKKTIDASYICCGPKECELKNYHKGEMIPNGYWKASATPIDPYHRSYQINALYTFLGGRDWTEIYSQMKAVEESDDPNERRDFDTLTKAIPFKETGKRPKISRQNPLRTTAKSKEIHDDIIFLTAAVDVQDGMKDPKLKKPRRLELNVMGHSTKHRAWHIEHRVFVGEIATPDGEAWEKLIEWHDRLIENPYRKNGRGTPFLPMFVFIDSGNRAPTVYEFCSLRNNFYPIKGWDYIQSKKQSADIDLATGRNYDRFRSARVGPGIKRYDIATNYYRSMLYANINRTMQHLKKPDADKQYGYIGFPADFTDEMFSQLTNPEMLSDGSFDKRGRPAEQHDLFVYNLCCGDVFIETRVIERQNRLKGDQRVNRNKIKNFTTQFALLEMKFEIGECTPEEEQQYLRTMADFTVF